MKVKTLFFSALASTMLFLGFSSCDNGTESSDLVGSWKQVHEYGFEKIDGEIIDEWDEPVTDEEITTFKNDGTGTWEDETFTWSLSGKTLTMNFASEEAGSGNYTVEKLTSSEAVISMTEKYEEDGVDLEGYYRMTFEKVK
jgi:hypothetical protein